MRFAILSDLHFGDENAVLSFKKDGKYYLGDDFSKIKDTISQVDFLILLGDVFDFSMSGYAGAYHAAKPFFDALVEHDICKKVIFVPGNHDFEFWNTLETEVNIIQPMHKGDAPQSFNWSVPCILDARKSAEEQINLVGVKKNQSGQYGGLFLDSFAQGLTFYVAHPNIYFIDLKAEVTLITHGQYFEAYWSIISEYLPHIVDNMKIDKEQMSIKDLVALNYATNQLTSSGIGLSGPFRDIAVKVQDDIYTDGFSEDLNHYIDNTSQLLSKRFHSYAWYGFTFNWLIRILIKLLARKFKQSTGSTKVAQFNEDFLKDTDVQKRFVSYVNSSLAELKDLKGYENTESITHVIFGHTHVPIAWEDKSFVLFSEGKAIYAHNSGGWIRMRDDKASKAEIFIYDSSVSMSSIRV